MAKVKVTPQPPSCKECQRRKQKCSREWPCQQCLGRKVPHLCQFGDKKNASDVTDEGIRAAISRKRSNADSEDQSTQSSDTLVNEPTGLVSWGYMSENKLFPMEAVVNDDVPLQAPDAPFIQADVIDSVLRDVPIRSMTDALVQNYLYKTNYRYYWLYPPTFQVAYSDWWEGRKTRRSLSPDFTCLLLRLCAVSTQHLTYDLRKRLEHEFAEDHESVGRRYFEAADKLHATLTPATCSIMRAQQLMLKASWYKAEGKPLETWHAVGEGVRVAQELGMHNGIDAQNLDEFESEMRKRLWCTLYIWDWQMSAWLNRPLIIDHTTCKLELPTLKLERRTDYPGLPSPFTHMALQAELIQILSAKIRGFGDTDAIEKVHSLQAIVESWMSRLPAAYSMHNPETKWDGEFAYLILQRLQLHSCAWMLKMDSFKSYLTRYLPADSKPIEIEFRARGIDCALNLHKATNALYEFEHPISTKFHLVTFLFFDVSVLFGAAIFHDKDFTLPRRPEVLLALEDLLGKFHLIGETTESGKNAYKFLSRLISRLRLKPGERIHTNSLISKRYKHDNGSPTLQDAGAQSSNGSSDMRTPSSTESPMRSHSSGIPQIGTRDDSIESSSSNDKVNNVDHTALWAATTAAQPISNFEQHFPKALVPNHMPEQFSMATDMPISALEFTVPTIANINMGGIEQIVGWDNYNFDLSLMGTNPGWLYDTEAFPPIDPLSLSNVQLDPNYYQPY